MQNIFILSGPSGAGEDSIINGLSLLLPLERIITSTTRLPRAGESEGHPYYFVSPETFQQNIADGALLEYAQEYNNQYYGVTKKEWERVAKSGKIGIWKIEYKGVQTAKRLFPDIIAILITAPLDVLRERIEKRDHPDQHVLEERMAYTKEWLKHQDLYDHIIENQQGKLDQAVRDTYALLQKHFPSI